MVPLPLSAYPSPASGSKCSSGSVPATPHAPLSSRSFTPYVHPIGRLGYCLKHENGATLEKILTAKSISFAYDKEKHVLWDHLEIICFQ